MYRKSILVFALVLVFGLAFAGPVSAMQTMGDGGGTSDLVTLTQLSGNRAGLNIVFAEGLEANTEGLVFFVNGHRYECAQTSLNSIYCIGYYDKSWKAISVTGFTLLGGDADTLVLDVDVPVNKVDGIKEVADGKDDPICETAFGRDDDCSEEPTFCELNPEDLSCAEPTFCELNPTDPTCAEPTFCELNPMDITCGGPTFCDLNPMDPTCDGPSYCELNPMDPICGGPSYCEVNPTDPICAGPSFCDLNPTDPSCGGGETPVDCELHPEDPSCSY